ncbi:innexin inx7-like [Galleria mellonella]|uniref:Innexin n=1 Tax=Galleria mellonella TaxID=7137 RepID=A0ABM3N5T5_GALME|nr:innexin inx7-like [Galleria mellonella]XP_052758846.1 innexin inx7-like [Galleria mellonella]
MLPATVSTLVPRLKLNFKKPKIDNFVFKLHYQFTVTLLIAFVILVCAREQFGEHIRCISGAGVPEKVIQTYCFFMATFTIVRHYNESLLQTGFLPHPGVGPILENDETIHHKYYQWVPFLLFLQSIAFYMPHYIWKKKEGGRIKALVDGLQFASLSFQEEDIKVNKDTIPSKKTIEKKIALIRKDIIFRLRVSRTWSVWMMAMEVANLLHVMFQIWLINRFLNGEFIGLGPKVLSFSDWNEIADPLEAIFPKVTKCLFHKYGPSGTIQQHDALCVMALNIVHEKIYVILWFWLLFLFIASVLAVIWRAMSFYLYRRSLRFNDVVFGQVVSGKFNPYNVIRVVNGCQFGDWLFLYYLAKNMQGFLFQELYKTLAEELEKRDMPLDQNIPEEVGAQPVLIATHEYSDETLPLKDIKKGA